MAEKRGGGGFFWGIVGFLIGVAATLALLAFMSRETTLGPDPRTAADEAAEDARELPAPTVPAPEVAAPKAETRAPVQPRVERGIDPSTDDQLVDDAASAGMTSRAPPPEE
ncbi:hypothetical protein GVN21_13510 [Caulobacter sp. SLTY]|uniref:hypothetical protein n=1 Tax=Caulobacter sp. SLTY TaxID=2683262 RepID=UPI0014128BE3|nr:hypothetical protein [Caulobacter sp. SLTY]NBB16377.1 hypothetical protein [Caulobacter sp. SLTY]